MQTFLRVVLAALAVATAIAVFIFSGSVVAWMLGTVIEEMEQATPIGMVLDVLLLGAIVAGVITSNVNYRKRRAPRKGA